MRIACLRRELHLCRSLMTGLAALLMCTGSAWAADKSDSSGFPMVDSVEAQPLLSQVKRLADALEFLGAPLSQETQDALGQINAKMNDSRVTQAVQKALDPYCVAAIEIDADSKSKATARKGSVPLVEQGWSTFLVKVVNDADVQTSLRVDSPNAKPVPTSPSDEVEARWLDLSLFNGRPLSPNLSGFPLEYRVLQMYSRDVGPNETVLKFNVGTWPESSKQPKGLIQEWQFETGDEGWVAANNTAIEAEDGDLIFTGTGPNPHMTKDVEAEEGVLNFRFWAEVEDDSYGQLFWWTKDNEKVLPRNRSIFEIKSGLPQEYNIAFPVKGELAGLRFHPILGEGKMKIDWISLSYADQPSKEWAECSVKVDAAASTPITFEVTDDKGEPAIAAFVITDEYGRIYPSKMKRVAPDFFFQPQVYRGTGDTVSLPDGNYTVVCTRGPESIPETKSLTVAGKPQTLTYQMKRWVDPAAYGWWSGDHHIHAAGCRHYTNPTEGVFAEDMARHCIGEDLKVGCNLTWGPCFDFQKQFFTGKIDKASQYPYLLRYDIEVSGFGSHRSGHLVLLRLQDQIYPGGDSSDHWPTLGLNTLRWAKKQGAICGPAHSGSGLEGNTGKVDGEMGPLGLPNYIIPSYNGIGANEYIMNITHEVPGPDGTPVPAIDFISTMDTNRLAEFNMWYHTLNCGYRVRASGETDFPCISGQRVGMGRVYVKMDDQLDFDGWCEGIRNGRSYVSDGVAHILDFEARPIDDPTQVVELGVNGSEMQFDKPTKLRLTAKAAVRVPNAKSVPIDVVVNGYPVESQQKQLKADGSLHDVSFDVEISKSSWVALRISVSAHTNPIFVLIDGKPIRASKASAEWCLKGVDQCWKMKEETYQDSELEGAKADYEHAREVFRKLIKECEAAEG